MSDDGNTYDALPYNDHAFVHAHPDRLAVVAALHGLTPPPVDRCRVLELGCGPGGHLLPMAATLPDSRFLGIDLSATQIERGRRRVEQLGLSNLELRRQDLMDFDGSEGPFDYILCHGVYSWVPPAVQERILSISARALAPHGLATISYNVEPGWHLRAVVRDLLRHGARGAGGPARQVARAIEFLRFTARSAFDSDSPYGRAVREAAEALSDESPTYIFHEYLEEHNRPVRFEQFVERAARAGLRYVGDATLRDPSAMLTDEARAHLNALGDDVVAREQTLDYLNQQAFRRDVFCHDDLAPRPWPDPAAVQSMCLIGLATPAAEAPAAPDAPEQFRIHHDRSLTTASPSLKAALRLLHRARPAGVAYADLLADIRQTVGAVDTDTLAPSLLACAMASFVELHTHLPATAARPTARPVATAVARMQAVSDEHVVNLRHENIRLGALSRAVLALLDGTRDRAALVEAVAAQRRAGLLKIDATDADLPGAIDEVLAALAGLSLLTA